jgi:hydrogenase-4 component F
MSLEIILLMPLLAAAVSAIPRIRRVAPVFTIASSVAALILACRGALVVVHGTTVRGLHGVLALDGLGALIVGLVSLVATTAAVYSWGYMARTAEEHPGRLPLYYASYNLFVFAMLAIPMVVEPTLVWIFVELTTLTSALLVSFENTQAALEAAWKYMALSLIGAAIALLGFLVLFSALRAAGGEPYTWQGLVEAAPRMPPALLKAAFVLIVVGLGTKVGLVPLHTWLPDAHSQAPSPICALLSGIETTSVLYVILRMLPVLDTAALSSLRDWMVAFGLISVGTAAFLLLQVRDYKRLFAFSTVEHMGIILVAAGLASQAAHYGALFQIVSHTITKSFCFFAAGAAVLTVTTREIACVRGLIRTSPTAGASLLLGGLAIAGAPPLAVFLSEFLILRAGLAEGRFVTVGLLTLFIVIAFFGVLLHVNRMVFGRAADSKNTAAAAPAQPSNNTPHKDGSAVATLALPHSCTAVLLVGGALVVVLGVYLPGPLQQLLRIASTALQR